MATDRSSELEPKAKATYEDLRQARDPYIQRARQAAALTLPFLMPPEGTSGSTALADPAQSLGSRGLRNIASKLSNSLFPVNTPFFRSEVDDIALAEITDGQDDKRGEVEMALAARERAVMAEFNSALARPMVFEACRQLALAGNYLVHIPKEGKVRGFRLTSYVVERDAAGNVLQIVIKEVVAKSALPEDLVDHLQSTDTSSEATSDRNSTVDVYTHIFRESEDLFVSYQEINDTVLPSDYIGEYSAESLPWVPVRLSFVEGEDYGRGLVEELIGDLTALESMTVALRDGTIQGAKVIWIVEPNSTVSPKKLSEAPNGGYVQGQINTINPLRLDKQADFAVAERYLSKLEERLSYGFLLHTAIQRQAERVTAEEIRYMAAELEQNMGGVYSLLSEEFQLPLVKLFTLRMEHSRNVPPLPESITSVSIVTGMEALGRGHDLQNLDAFIAGATNAVGPEAVARYVNVGEYFRRRAAASNVDDSGLIRSDEDIAQAEQQAQMQQMIQHLGPQALQQMGGMAQAGLAQGGAPEASAQPTPPTGE